MLLVLEIAEYRERVCERFDGHLVCIRNAPLEKLVRECRHVACACVKRLASDSALIVDRRDARGRVRARLLERV